MSESEPQTAPPLDVAANLFLVRQRVAEAAAAHGRDADSVRLVAVTKSQPVDLIRRALRAGQREFGENRVQEAQAKYPELRAAFPDLELRLIGPLQSNKARQAVELFDVIETLDRPSLAAALAAEMARVGRRVPCYVQVNTGEEPQKAGVAPGGADAFIALARERHGLPVLGLMCIPPAADEPGPHFALLRKIAARNGLGVLSMGMSADFEIAIQFGATHVRVGTAIFGARL